MTTFTVKDFIEKLETLPLDTPVVFIRPSAYGEGDFEDDPEEAVRDWAEYLPEHQLSSPQKLAEGSVNPYYFVKTFYAEEYQGLEIYVSARVKSTVVRTEPMSEEEINALVKQKPHLEPYRVRKLEREKKKALRALTDSAATPRSVGDTEC